MDNIRQNRLIDRIVPRTRFGQSVFSTPILLLFRLFFQAGPVDYASPTIRRIRIRRTPSYQWVARSSAISKQIHWRTTTSPALQAMESQSLQCAVSPQTWHDLLRNPQYPINSSWSLISLTWVHSLSSPLSHEYLQFILSCPQTHRSYRLIAERDTEGDWVFATATCSSRRTGKTQEVDGFCSNQDVETMRKDDEHHGFPLPLLSLSWSKVTHSARPTAMDLSEVLTKVSRQGPGYSWVRFHCWWFAESVFEEMLVKSDLGRRQGSVMLKQWPWAAYRYSYIVVGKRFCKREVLIQEAKRFRIAMDMDGELQW